MKIVIDIDENEYRHIKEIYEKNDIVESTYSYIYHGTPLDDIKSEITRYTDTHCNNGYILRESVFEILEQKGETDADSD